MQVTSTSRLVVRTDADGALLISQRGALDDDACRRLNEAIIGALRSGSTAVVIDLHASATADAESVAGVRRVLRAGEALAHHLSVAYEVRGTEGVGAEGLEPPTPSL